MSIAECPRCGYHLETDLKVRALDVHLANDAIEDPQKGVSALEAEGEKASLLRRINNTREKTRCLPFEVLSNIFQFARPPIDFTAVETTVST
ncbi:hypothetical protein AGABI1DRAFT_131353 [Agaricus bisporus var. burnettii JB137-S8]|uniref:Uncharacterized protein n=1 Tax=Agaricus bisporus var. burnettii (strain JB137-S8 / ATCC MYA-4627 / FGSC 10392) TaxID=597362 RepID=K5X0W3_AGABU|nr:uncharacterized protein AGABI1DRAFT_131353 [Agaricus bisporus var. burnettii JB137-S8]EKM76532.1 hypothetical protein AGABI1DRAFT_131353 [Agaricus bisporus var. burnettii JB137-S8]